MNILREHFQTLDSTNDYIKTKRTAGKDLIVTADMQTGGRGTKGRAFSSQKGGVYLSELRFYENFPAKEAFQIMSRAATAVCKTLCFYGIKPVIKWPNDIFVNDKKICGILIENTFLGDKIASSVVGVGLNVCNALEEELAEIAITMQQATGKTFSVEEVRERLIRELQKAHTMDEYLSYIGYLGRRVTLILGDERIPATLVSVETDGKLRAETENGERLFSSAEVSLRI